jgi:flavin reductase (DIM6/NTAB) family NADH-FMN oxidoreductase RutF
MGLPHELFRRLTAGVYVISAAYSGRSDAFTAAWVMQVSFDPLLVAVSVNPGNATWPLIRDGRRFVISVLGSGQTDLARHFGTTTGRDGDKFAGVATVPTGDGQAIASAVAWFGCTVHEIVAAGDHIIVLARVMNGALLNPSAVPLRYDETGNMDGSAALYPSTF